MASRLLALALAAGVSFVSTGCTYLVGDHPFSSTPASRLGRPARFNPGAALFTRLSVPPQACAMEQGYNAAGALVAAQPVTLFIQFSHPFEPWRDAAPRLTIGDRRLQFPVTADHSWVLEAPFGLGMHDVVVEVVRDGEVLYARTLSFSIYPKEFC